MNILMITPHRFPEISGNSTDVERIASGLMKKGHTVVVTTPSEAESVTGRFDVKHAFHAYRCRVVRKVFPGIPFIVTMTGTDYNHDIDDPKKAPEIMRVLREAKAVTFLNPGARDSVVARLPVLKEKAYSIRRGCEEMKASSIDFREQWGTGDSTVFTMVGGLREVKNNLYPIPLLGKLHAEGLDIRYVMVGPVLDKRVMERFDALKEKYPFASYEGSVPHSEMEGVYRASDVIVNSSISEGDSNAISEAKCVGKAVLAIDIPGNSQAITDGVDGLLFSGDDDFIRKARMLCQDTTLRKKLGDRAHCMHHLNLDESEEYISAYGNMIR